MDTKTLYDRFLRYFKIQEIVSPQCYQDWKHKGAYFFLSRFDPRLLETMVFTREKLGKKITINDWLWGGDFDERGLRDNLTAIVQGKHITYLSGHALSMAFDFDVEDMTASAVREWLIEMADELPYKIRLECRLNGKLILWVHLDVIDEPKNPKVYCFNV